MMRLIAGLTFFFMLSGISGADASRCFMPREAEAEQGIRIHSELMVIGLNCQHVREDRTDRNLYASYRDFTRRHLGLFAAYERILLAHFESRGDSNPEASLNALRTDFANKISNDAARMRPDNFCARYAPRISKVSGMEQMDVRKWAATIFPTHPVSKPLCDFQRKG